MAELCRFLGMVITMYADDHPPPHVHVRHGDDMARVLLTGEILSGSLPRTQRKAIQKWVLMHEPELAACWERAMRQEPPGTIEPL
jgi:hypothetical protein